METRSMNGINDQLRTEIEALRLDNMKMRAEFEAAERRSSADRRRGRTQAGFALAAVAAAILLSPASRSAMADTGSDILSRLTALENKTQFVIVDAEHNTMIVNGA